MALGKCFQRDVTQWMFLPQGVAEGAAAATMSAVCQGKGMVPVRKKGTQLA